MKRLIVVLVLLVVCALIASADWPTVETFDRGYITAAVHLELAASDSGDITPPIISSDTLDTRGFIIGCCSPQSGRGHGVRMRYRQEGLDGWYRWNQWLECSTYNPGMLMTGSWAGFGGVNSLGMTPFMPLVNVKLLRLINPNTVASQSMVVIWFMDQREAKAADWSKWEMPNK